MPCTAATFQHEHQEHPTQSIGRCFWIESVCSVNDSALRQCALPAEAEDDDRLKLALLDHAQDFPDLGPPVTAALAAAPPVPAAAATAAAPLAAASTSTAACRVQGSASGNSFQARGKSEREKRSILTASLVSSHSTGWAPAAIAYGLRLLRGVLLVWHMCIETSDLHVCTM